jgi:hypothetical protein
VGYFDLLTIQVVGLLSRQSLPDRAHKAMLRPHPVDGETDSCEKDGNDKGSYNPARHC